VIHKNKTVFRFCCIIMHQERILKLAWKNRKLLLLLYQSN